MYCKIQRRYIIRFKGNIMNIHFVPNNPEAISLFRQIVLEPNDEKPIVEMNDETARDMNIIWASIDALAVRWRGEKDSRVPGMPSNRKEFWGAFAQGHEPQILPVAQEFIDSTSGQGKLAIDLGCGKGGATNYLLQKGWRVIAVDYSRSALKALELQNSKEVKSGQLRIIEAEVAAFVPSEPADLVIAADVLPYINPSKFHATWTKIHDTFIKDNGFFVGSLFRDTTKSEEVPVMNMLKEMGAWFLHDRRMVRPLLTQAGYEIKKCIYRIDDPTSESTCIQFIAEKKTTV